MLLSSGLPLPKTLLVHGFITSGGKKMSKSLGNVIDPEELITEYGTEAVRYYLARHISPFDDGDITREGFKEAYNGNLVNGLGNLVSRVMQMAEKNNVVTPIVESTKPTGLESNIQQAMEAFKVNEALDYIWSEIQRADRKITEKEPFKVIRDDPVIGKALIQDLVQEVYIIAKALKPFLPQTSEKILEAIKANKKPENLFPRKE
jgi:methionyl-tRNA synthetase